MKKSSRAILIVAALMLTGISSIRAQSPVLLHSHNDYERSVPFYLAYSQRMNSVEADIHLCDGRILVGHDPEDLRDELTIEDMYLKPMVKLFGLNQGKLWKDSDNVMQLLIDLKTDGGPTLDTLTKILRQWPEVFDPCTNRHAVRIVITGNVPSPEKFGSYPRFISFDGNLKIKYTEAQLERVALFSANFRDYANWNGKGTLTSDDRERIAEAVETAHSRNKPIRFWNAPEGVTVYYTFPKLGIDYINTDYPEKCAEFFSDWNNKNYLIGQSAIGNPGRVETYMPAFKPYGRNKKPRNIILLIGDGMGLNQITAGAYCNQGLTILNLKNIGFQTNHPEGDFTTDSAGAGSALATGRKHRNRQISCNDAGKPVKTLAEELHDNGYATGIVTLGNVADATPAAFYGHSADRDSTEMITRCLTDGKIDLLCGSGIRNFTERKDGIDMETELSRDYDFIRNLDEMTASSGKVICIDERMEDAANESNMNLLQKATESAIECLGRAGKKGFFLMVEGAKIDYAGHSRCLPGIVMETLSFDLAVAEALKFADKDGETLVIVTADHETGGLVLLDGEEENGRITGTFTTKDHTPSLVPVFSYGPESELFKGTYPNTEIPEKIRRAIHIPLPKSRGI